MSSQRIIAASTGSGLILAALPLLAGVALSAFWALDDANRGQREHVKLVCAMRKLATLPKDALRPPKERVTGASYPEKNCRIMCRASRYVGRR